MRFSSQHQLRSQSFDLRADVVQVTGIQLNPTDKVVALEWVYVENC
ncbi:hypothetical protein [Chroogloeocystis siderophila]|nr:hypothetical protein [Chroogloeocystis siderophila]